MKHHSADRNAARFAVVNPPLGHKFADEELTGLQRSVLVIAGIVALGIVAACFGFKIV